jgi:hypothetical protein
MKISDSKLRIVLANGSLAKYPPGGGHWTAFLQYLLGLDALGHEVFWLELLRSTGNKERDHRLIKIFLMRLQRYGFAGRCGVLLFDCDIADAKLESAKVYGVSKKTVEEIIRSADLVWNFCCTLRQPLLSSFKYRALIDLDPGMVQVPELSDHFAIADHHFLLTVGSKMGEPECRVPTAGRMWRRFMPFVHLPAWEPAPDPGQSAPFTSVTQWTWDEVWYEDHVYSASKREAFLRYLEVPRRAGRRFELAANIDPGDITGDRELLVENGWDLTHPHQVARTPSLYRAYLKNSRAEFSCSKPIYRELRTGWFSDRSACYLASGRPVVAEDTGFSEHVPTGLGLFAFNSLDEALGSVAAIDHNYACHSRAARALAEEYFSSEKSLLSMLAACRW